MKKLVYVILAMSCATMAAQASSKSLEWSDDMVFAPFGSRSQTSQMLPRQAPNVPIALPEVTPEVRAIIDRTVETALGLDVGAEGLAPEKAVNQK
jgi:hypothetical protein